jgi:hypothetical protein
MVDIPNFQRRPCSERIGIVRWVGILSLLFLAPHSLRALEWKSVSGYRSAELAVPKSCVGVSPAHPHIPQFGTESYQYAGLTPSSAAICRDCRRPLGDTDCEDQEEALIHKTMYSQITTR